MAPEPNWLVQIPDKSGASILKARQDNLEAHLGHNKVHGEAGRIVMSGPVVQEHPKKLGDPIAIKGSIMVWKAGSEAEVRALLSEDPYAKTGVWDLDQATVTPFLCAVRRPL